MKSLKMAVNLKRHFPTTLFIVFLLTVSKIHSIEPFEDEKPCSDGCSVSTVNPTISITTETRLPETQASTNTEGKMEMTSVTEERDKDKGTTSTDINTATTKDIDESTTSKPKISQASTTPASPAVTTMQIPPLITTVAPSNRTNPYGDHCPCDLMVNSCDPNCCCDVNDCSEKDQEAFSGCLALPTASPDPRHCLQYKWVSTPNHTLHLETFYNESGFLCIVRDNNPRRFALQDQNPIDSIEDFQTLIERKIVFKWPTPRLNDPQFNVNSSYKAGDILWAVQNLYLYPLAFLASGFNTVCQSKKWVRFLKDWESSCTLPLPYMLMKENPENSPDLHAFQEECSRFSAYKVFKELVLLSSPHVWLNLSSNICPPEVCVHTQPWVCSGQSFTNCHEAEEVPYAQLKGDVCINTLLGVRLVVHVVGVNIHSAQVYFVLSNVSFSSLIPAISRKHSVIFNWWSSEDDIGIENDKDRTIWRRSGNPGYLLGRPVMAGWKETVVLGGEDLKQREDGVESGIMEGIRVTPNPKGWLTVLGPEEGGHACGEPRRSVQFGYSARWSCSVSLSPDDFTIGGCVALKKKTLGLLLGWGSIGNLSERYIAMFGDSSPEKVNEWIPLKIISTDDKEIKDIVSDKEEHLGGSKMRKPCIGLHTSIHLELATALVGSVVNPQAKLVGAILTLGHKIEVEPHRFWISWQSEIGDVTQAPKTESKIGEMRGLDNEGKNKSNAEGTREREDGYQKKYLILVTSVKFIDVTGPPTMDVASPPVYHIRLPYGFFYPFLSCAPSPSYQLLNFVGSFVTILYYSKSMEV